MKRFVQLMMALLSPYLVIVYWKNSLRRLDSIHAFGEGLDFE